MKKTGLRRLLFLIVLLIIIFMIILMVKKIHTDNTSTKSTVSLKEFNLYTIDSVRISSDTNYINNNKMFVIFHPSCGPCYDLFENIIEDLERSHHTFVIMLSDASNDSIKEFVGRFDIGSLKNIAYCHASDSLLNKLFGSVNSPSVFLFDRNDRLLVKFEVEIAANDIDNLIH